MHFKDNIFKKQHLSMPMYKVYFRILIFKRVIGSVKVGKIKFIENFQLYGGNLVVPFNSIILNLYTNHRCKPAFN